MFALHAMFRYQCRHRTVTIETKNFDVKVTSSSRHSFKILSTTVGNIVVATCMMADLWRHLTYKSREASLCCIYVLETIHNITKLQEAMECLFQ